MVYNLSIKKFPDNVIIKVYEQTNNTNGKVALFNTGKRDSCHGYKKLGEADYEYRRIRRMD